MIHPIHINGQKRLVAAHEKIKYSSDRVWNYVMDYVHLDVFSSNLTTEEEVDFRKTQWSYRCV